jgi:ABC-type phosphate/phosphonate transport system substrate-binding protein
MKLRSYFATAVGLFIFSWMSLSTAFGAEVEPTSPKPWTMVVMDPLAAPLSCPCVEGYAQRKYEVLAEYLGTSLGREVKVVFAESLLKAQKELKETPIDIIIGKDSVVRMDSAKLKLEVAAIARLTDKLGSTTQHGLIVVRKDDPAQGPSDLAGYHIIFGPAAAQEKHAAAVELLTQAGIEIQAELTIDEACSDGACKVMELGPEGKGAAVISSYAAPLLEGCGTIKKGDLRVIGKTKAVPFITAFACSTLETTDQQSLQAALLKVAEKRDVCKAIESLVGFVQVKTEEESSKKK